MSRYKHPDEVGGGGTGFLMLLVLAAAYGYFVIYDLAGNFKACDEQMYPYQLVCIPDNHRAER